MPITMRQIMNEKHRQDVCFVSRCKLGIGVSALMATALACPFALHSQVTGPIPPSVPVSRAYQLLRYQEDWSFLRDPQKRVDWLDPIKYIPLGNGGEAHYLSIGGEFRGVEEQIKYDNWGGTPYPVNQFNLQRFQLHFDTRAYSRLRFFIQFESGLEEGRAGGPRPIDEKRLDFLNAFADLRIGSLENPITLRVGRQELQFGSGRLVAVREGPNVRQGFYGLRVSHKVQKWSLDEFAVRPAEDNPGFFDNVPLHSTGFWGIYSTRPWTATSRNQVDAYYFGLDRKSASFDRGFGHEVRQTVGTRIASRDPTSTVGRIAIPHFDVDAVYQFGTFASANIRAWSVASEFGCILPALTFTPRIGIRSDISSGDRTLKSGDLGTFNPLFPIGNYFGVLADTGTGPINFRDVHPEVRLFLPHSVSVDTDWLIWWRQSLGDGVYGVPGNLIVPAGRAMQGSWATDREPRLDGRSIDTRICRATTASSSQARISAARATQRTSTMHRYGSVINSERTPDLNPDLERS
jgi:hypothetical protein